MIRVYETSPAVVQGFGVEPPAPGEAVVQGFSVVNTSPFSVYTGGASTLRVGVVVAMVAAVVVGVVLWRRR